MPPNTAAPSSREAAAAAPSASAVLETIRLKLWCALPSVQNFQQQQQAQLSSNGEADDATAAANAAAPPAEGHLRAADSGAADDVHNESTAALLALLVPHADMAQLVACVYRALHCNATAADAAAAVRNVLHIKESTQDCEDESGAAASTAVGNPGKTYTFAELCAFLDTVPSRWVPQLVAAQKNFVASGAAARVPAATAATTGDSSWMALNEELVECVVYDVAPHRLLDPAEVFTVQRATAAVQLDAPVTDYVAVPPPRQYPAVYDTLFTRLGLDGRRVTSLSLAQFRLYFNWFYGMHFRNVDLPRADAAAEDLHRRHRDTHGEMSMAPFQAACKEMCAVYAQQRDAASYLQQLVSRTESVLSPAKPLSNVEAPGSTRADGACATNALSAFFFLHPERVTLPAWRRDLVDPTQLYLPDELRAVQQEVESYHRHTSPRILLIGPLGIGKGSIGKALADTLHCVHLDVLELAVKRLQDRRGKATVSATLAQCLEQRSPVPVEVQVALLRDAMQSEAAQYRGYVLSDTLCGFSASQTELLDEHLVRPLRVFEEARPTHVVELVSVAADVYAEYATTRAAEAADARIQSWSAFMADQDRKQQAMEKVQMKADCEKILARLVRLESGTVGGSSATSPADLEQARQQAAEAQNILDALNAEEEEESGKSDGAVRAEAEDAEEPASPEAAATKAQEELRLRLAALIYEGREAAGLLPPHGAPSFVPLAEQDWSSRWRKCVEEAKAVGRHLAVDPVASVSTEEVTSYIRHAFQLYPCDEAAPLMPAVAGAEQPEEHTQGGLKEGGRRARLQLSPATESEEKDRLAEEVAQEKGLELSPVWKRFCPVMAAQEGVLVDSAARFACSYRGRYYCCSSVSCRDAFVANPVRYLRQSFPAVKPVLLLAEDALLHSPAAAAVLEQIAEELENKLRLTRHTVSAYASLLKPRLQLLRARASALTKREKSEEAARQARQARKDQAAKAAVAANKKGKLEPSKPKGKKLSASQGRAAPSQAASGPSQEVNSGESAARRRKQQEQAAAAAPASGRSNSPGADDAGTEGKPIRGSAYNATVLLTAVTDADLQLWYLQSLWEQQALPDTVVVLRATTPSSRSSSDVEEGNELEDDEGAAANDGTAIQTKYAAAAAATTNSPVLREILQLLKRGTKGDSAINVHHSESASSPSLSSSFQIHDVPVAIASAAASEVVAEVTHLLNPLSIQATEDAVDETLPESEGGNNNAAAADGGGDGDDEDEENEEALEEEEALLYPEGTQRPPRVPLAPRHPLVKPTRRFLHQFGSRLDYCPVALHDRGILVRGKRDLCLRYADGLYIFASEDARDAFARCPQRYIADLAPQSLPPRVWLLGVTQSGKKTLAAGLQETYRIPFFVYDRKFFSECVEAALTPGGGLVRGVYIPPDATEKNPHLARAQKLLEEVHHAAKAEKEKLEEKAEAERLLAEHEAREEAGDDQDSFDDDDDSWTEEKEAQLQEKLEFEPEDEEEKQLRLSEFYLRIASCVTRLQPFDRLGYVMICPPFSEGDLDVLFDEGGIPEVVVRLNVDEEIFNQRSARQATERRAMRQRAKTQDVAAVAREARQKATQLTRDAARVRWQREKALRKWRRRHIGADDVDVPSADDEEGPGGEEGAGESGGQGHADKGSHDHRQTTFNGVEDDGNGSLEDDTDVGATWLAQEEALEDFMRAVEDRLVEVVQINAAAARDTVRRAVEEALGRHLRHRESLFYRPEVLKFDDAAARREAGQCDFSSFVYQDPVRLYAQRMEGQRSACAWKPAGVRVGPEDGVEGDEDFAHASQDTEAPATAANAAPTGEPIEEPEELSEVASNDVEELREVVERRRRRAQRQAAPRVARVLRLLYFFESDETLLHFVRNPWPFMQQPPPLPTLLQAPVVSVYEPDTRAETESDGTKQRCLADSVAFNLKVKCASVTSLLAWAAVHPHWQSLRLDCMLAAQRNAADVGLLQKLLRLYLSSAAVKKRGAVLHNLPRTAAAAADLSSLSTVVTPITKVISAASPREESSTVADEGIGATVSTSASTAPAEMVVASMLAYASVELSLPRPQVPLDSSNLVRVVHGVQAFQAHAQEAVLREARAFPVAVCGSYEVFAHVRRHLSEYGEFCPYEWREHGDLVRSLHVIEGRGSNERIDMRCGAKYLGHYFFFSTEAYLQRFLLYPTTVTDPTTAKPMPKHLPTLVSLSAAAARQETDFALEGCCPVLLYDTRDRRGLRGVAQPIARKGSRDCVVEYDGAMYAMLDADHQQRFLRRPWQYVQGAQLPDVLHRPLPDNGSPASIAEDREYVRRQLYDPVSLALLAVAKERPLYPGLSAEQSALQYVALHLRAHRDPSTVGPFAMKAAQEAFAVFHEAATAYRQQLPAGVSSSTSATSKKSSAEAAIAAASVASADELESAAVATCAEHAYA